MISIFVHVALKMCNNFLNSKREAFRQTATRCYPLYKFRNNMLMLQHVVATCVCRNNMLLQKLIRVQGKYVHTRLGLADLSR